ncbi:MAG: hypothetical protein NT145_07070 [Elusimicrobia bacterium]|nr:hypothetical protein [Elusimicrobiota bacterium]
MKRNIILFIALIFIMKSLTIVNGIEISLEVSSPVIQSAFSQAISVIDLPFSIMANIIKELPLVPEYKQAAKEQNRKKESHSQNNKCLFFLNPTKELKTKLKTNIAEKTGGKIGQAITSNLQDYSKYLLSMCEKIIPVAICIFLILLPRSDIPLSARTLSCFIRPNYVLNVIGFFNFWADENIISPYIIRGIK